MSQTPFGPDSAAIPATPPSPNPPFDEVPDTLRCPCLSEEEPAPELDYASFDDDRRWWP